MTNVLSASRAPPSVGKRRLSFDRLATAAAFLTPLFLMHSRSLAEVSIVSTDLYFLVSCWQTRRWTWLGRSWMPYGLVWWAWLVVCSAPVPVLGLGEGGLRSFVEALAVIRFLVFTAALEQLVLDSDAARRWFYWLIAACALYIASQALLQFATGHNLYGDRPGLAGELTGPFDKPRAGPPLSRLLPPVLIPPASLLAERRRLLATCAAYALLLVGICVMVLINQRMPLLLTGFAFLVSAFLLPRLRPAVVIAAVAGLALIAASALVSPNTHARLVTQFSHQMEDFASSHYGLIYARSFAIAEQHPITGRGFDGFRTGCPQPRYFRPSFDGREPNGSGASICTEHPHNFYAEALTNAGIPGLILFTTLAVTWLRPLWRILLLAPDPLRVGLFASILIQLWPLASTSGFTSMPMGGWFFLLLGWALAVAHATPQSSD